MDIENTDNKDPAEVPNDENRPSSSSQTPPSPPLGYNLDHCRQLLKQTPKMAIIFALMALSFLIIFQSSIILPFSGGYSSLFANNHTSENENSLSRTLKNAAMSSKTVIITSLNDAWAEPQSMFDLLLESFRIGNQTARFLKHLVVVNLDEKAYARCLKIHPHCYNLINDMNLDSNDQAFFMTADYLKIVWKKIDFLSQVLDLGYSFVFSDADIMWFRDPFSQFDKNADIQIACDYFNGNPFDLKNLPNTGFSYVKSNNKTIQFYKFWYNSRITYPNLHDQDAFNMIKFDPFVQNLTLRVRFIDTAYFGGFCQPSRDLNKVCTMHANCCVGLENKVHDLAIMLDDWRKYLKFIGNLTTTNSTLEYNESWTVPQLCRDSFSRPRAPKKKGGQERNN